MSRDAQDLLERFGIGLAVVATLALWVGSLVFGIAFIGGESYIIGGVLVAVFVCMTAMFVGLVID